MSLAILNGNERKLLRALLAHGAASKPKLQKASGVEPCRVTSALLSLELAGLLTKSREGSRTNYAPTAKALRLTRCAVLPNDLGG